MKLLKFTKTRHNGLNSIDTFYLPELFGNDIGYWVYVCLFTIQPIELEIFRAYKEGFNGYIKLRSI